MEAYLRAQILRHPPDLWALSASPKKTGPYSVQAPTVMYNTHTHGPCGSGVCVCVCLSGDMKKWPSFKIHSLPVCPYFKNNAYMWVAEGVSEFTLKILHLYLTRDLGRKGQPA